MIKLSKGIRYWYSIDQACQYLELKLQCEVSKIDIEELIDRNEITLFARLNCSKQ